jgi:hypothetical protein
MELAIWIGAAMTVAGLIGIFWCVRLAIRANRAKLPDDRMRAEMQKVVVLNVAALGISALGLGLVAVGVILS